MKIQFSCSTAEFHEKTHYRFNTYPDIHIQKTPVIIPHYISIQINYFYKKATQTVRKKHIIAVIVFMTFWLRSRVSLS